MALDFPANPVNGQAYGSYIYNASVGAWQSKEDPATVATVSTVAPTSGNPGDIWYDSDDGTTYIYYDDGNSGQWVELLSSGVPLLNTKADLAGATFTGNVTAPQLVSNIATGTAPLVITSTTAVTNLNADLLDGNHSTAFALLSSAPTFTGNVSAPRFISTQATGTAPFSVTSTTAVANLNADLLDGQHGSVYAPAGMVSQFAGSSAPTGWLLCDGTSKLTADYPSLFAAIGYTYGGSGSSFNLPNLKGKVPVGLDSADTAFDVLGETGGAKTHTLTEAQMPSHSHRVSWSGADIAGASYGGQVYSSAVGGYAPWFGGGYNSTPATFESKGGNQAHNNLQPYIVLNYIIKT